MRRRLSLRSMRRLRFAFAIDASDTWETHASAMRDVFDPYDRDAAGDAGAENDTARSDAGGVWSSRRRLWVQGTVQLSVMVTEDPEGMVGTMVPAPCKAATSAAPVAAGQTAPPMAAHVAVGQFKLVGSGSVMSVLFAGFGPLLVATML
jgi:hypothetical protein